MSEPTGNLTTEYSDRAGVTPEWATDPVDQPYTPERVAAIWIQATSTMEAYLASDRPDLARNMIEEIDTNLRDFAAGGYPPGSDEMAGIYTDAICRAAIPYGQPPISAEEVARHLNNVGLSVPTIDVDTLAARTGVTPLHPAHTVNRIDGDFAGAWEQAVGNSYSQPVSHGPILDYGFGTPAITVSIGDARDWDSTFRVSLESDGSTALTVSGDDPVDLATISQTTGLPEHEVQQIITGATTALRSTLPSPEGQPATEPALVDLAAARMSVRRAIASITSDSEAAQAHLQSANRALTEAVEALRPDQVHPGVTAAQESVQQASEKVAAVTETAAKTDAEVTLYTKSDCPGCFATKRALHKAGVEYDEINLEQHPELLAQFKRQGMMQAPIVETKDGERWAGYNPAKLKEHGLDYRTRQQRGSGPDTGQGCGR
ncbi:glutaredoxin family protein [Brachybacterium sp. UNK5269]|uniref:glutaredoxin family protein n=1 Tax=Brachybacterium sp. UNK5269 TaxID=3408576 RepID=UPI003BAE2BE5